MIRLAVSAVLLAAAWLSPLAGIWRLLAFLVPYLIAGYTVLWQAAKNILHGEIFDEGFLMAIATIGALFIGEYPEAVFVMIFFQVGELFEALAVGRSRRSIEALMDIRPDYANLEKDGETRQVSPEEVGIGEIIVVKPGEKIPLDGVVESGSSSLNTMALTGEPAPRDAAPGDSVISGCVNLTGVLRVRVEKRYAESTVAKILELVENSAENKARSESFIRKFARWYTPAVVIAAVLLAVVPSVITGQWSFWVYKALTLLVISCPCALVVSVPLAFFGGIGGASRCGILVKGGNYLEALADAKTVVFDKTGTLTRGSFFVTTIHPTACSEEELLELAAAAERYSDHPISLSIREAYGKSIDKARVQELKELAGHGVSAKIDGRAVLVGNERLMQANGVDVAKCTHEGTMVHVAADGQYLGHIVIDDAVKPDSADAILALRRLGVTKTVMLTGDQKSVAERVGRELGLDEVRAELLPGDKVGCVEELLVQKANGTLLFVGDGMNDAPVLSRADVGVAMGALGSDAAIEAADVVLMDDQPSKLALAIRIGRRTRSIARQNIVFALAVKLAFMVLTVLGVTNMGPAVFADVGVMVLAVLNSTRAMRIRQ
ncbi:MAG: heavy metal translocating P-type ATPase [Oscillospiraceae bacterium]